MQHFTSKCQLRPYAYVRQLAYLTANKFIRQRDSVTRRKKLLVDNVSVNLKSSEEDANLEFAFDARGTRLQNSKTCNRFLAPIWCIQYSQRIFIKAKFFLLLLYHIDKIPIKLNKLSHVL